MDPKHCSWEECTNPRAYYWEVEGQFLCHLWLSKFHSNCKKFIQLIDISCVSEDIADLETWVQDVQRYIKAFNLERNYKGVEEELSIISKEIEDMRAEYEIILESDDYSRFKSIQQKSMEARNKFLESTALHQQLIHEKIRTRSKASKAKWGVNSWCYKEELDLEFEEELIKTRKSIATNYETDVIQKLNEQKRNLTNLFEAKYNDMVNYLTAQINSLKEQLAKVMYFQENNKLNEFVVEKLKMSKFNLKVNLDNSLDQSFMNLLAFWQVQKMGKISIDYLTEYGNDVQSFNSAFANFKVKSSENKENCIESIYINQKYYKPAIDMGFFMEGLRKLLPQVKKTIYLSNFKISKKEFEELMMLWSNWHEVVLKNSILDLADQPDLSKILNSEIE